MTSDLYFNKESDNSKENTSGNEDFCSPFSNHFSLSQNRKNVLMKAMRKN